MKTFADDKIYMTERLKFVWEGKKTLWENAGYQYFLTFPQCFQKAYSLGL